MDPGSAVLLKDSDGFEFDVKVALYVSTKCLFMTTGVRGLFYPIYSPLPCLPKNFRCALYRKKYC
jgi:predicted benzoate:H+ symporter BenE